MNGLIENEIDLNLVLNLRETRMCHGATRDINTVHATPDPREFFGSVDFPFRLVIGLCLPPILLDPFIPRL